MYMVLLCFVFCYVVQFRRIETCKAFKKTKTFECKGVHLILNFSKLFKMEK